MELHEYQQRAAQFIESHNSCILSVDMGLGKTAAVLSYIKETRPASVCIIAPKRVAENTWKQEAYKWGWPCVAERMAIVSGKPKQRKAAIADTDKPYKVVSRERVKEVQDLTFDLLVIDELTSFKNTESKRTQAVCKIHAARKVGLTGTFLANGAIDIYGQCAAVGIRCGFNFYAWRATYFRDALQGSGLAFHKWQLAVPLEQVLQPIADRVFTLTAADYLTIPSVSHIRHDIALDADTMAAYRDLDAFLGFNMNGDTLTVEEGAKFAKLQTLCNGFIYDANGGAIRSECSAKLEAVADFVADCRDAGEPVLLFYAFREEAIWLQELLTERGVKCESVQRSGFMERWNAGDTECLFAHPASAGHGLNLQHGGRVIVWSSLTYNYEYYAQANARLARQGQTRQVQVHYFLTRDTCEPRVWTALQKKDREQKEFLNKTKQ